MTPGDTLRELFAVALAAVDPACCVAQHLPQRPLGRTVVFAFGKAAASMATAVEAAWDGPLEGIAVTRYGHGLPLERIELREADHPHSDEAGAQAARDMLALAATLGPDDLALCLVSGGGSALTSLPAPGVSTASKRAVLRALLASGAPIVEINAVRQRLSAFKGGRLAAACAPAHVHSIVLSDIPGDDASLVASGPSFAMKDAQIDVGALLARWRVGLPDDVARFLALAARPVIVRKASFAVAAKASTALEAVAARARSLGLTAVILSDRIEGEARLAGRDHALLACKYLDQPGTVLLSGGETSVTVTGHGKGGRNAEFLAALAIEIEGLPITALAADTDGIDGSEDNAGAVCDGTSIARARALGQDAAALLADNDAYALFAGLGDLVVTGPTRTNVNDFRAILIGAL